MIIDGYYAQTLFDNHVSPEEEPAGEEVLERGSREGGSESKPFYKNIWEKQLLSIALKSYRNTAGQLTWSQKSRMKMTRFWVS